MSDTEFSDSRKGWVTNWEQITLPKLNIGGGDGNNDGGGDKDHAGDDGCDGVQTIDSVKSCFFGNLQNQK